uniref:Ig-like domain-containing protein n=1 Tax=Paramormyrops kingsleyae TaxID=1676925 RepID=A0A3B3SL55_9TELE
MPEYLLSYLSFLPLCSSLQLPLVCSLVSSLSIFYQRTTLNKTVGEKLYLTCNLRYNTGDCGEITAFWCKHHGNCQELKDEQRYITMVSENNVQDTNFTQRQIELEIESLVLNDTGSYQCIASCRRETATGHIITLFLKGKRLSSVRPPFIAAS